MRVLKQRAIRLSARLGLPRFFFADQERAVTTIVHHAFIEPNESPASGRSRLRWQCEALRERFTPISTSRAVQGLCDGTLPVFPLVVTIDDAYRDLIEAAAIFAEFEIPITSFVVPGWVAVAEFESHAPRERPPATLELVVDALHWERLPGVRVRVRDPGGGPDFIFDAQAHARSIDELLVHPHRDDREFLNRIWNSLPTLSASGTPSCSWDELRALRSPLIEFGSHTVSHCRLAQQSATRIQYETCASKALVESQLGECTHFAYPYGTQDVFDERTTLAVREAGYASACTTSPGFAVDAIERFRLPRNTMPDEAVPPDAYRALLAGGKIPLEHAMSFVSALRATRR